MQALSRNFKQFLPRVLQRPRGCTPRSHSRMAARAGKTPSNSRFCRLGSCVCYQQTRRITLLTASENGKPLVGRAAECAKIGDLIAGARAGRSSVLVLHGEPGIGKTTLLEHAVRAAAPAAIVEARGVEAETAIPFAGLADLLKPLLGTVESIPPPQAAALRGALALDAPVPGDPFTVSAAFLSVLGAAAEEGPLLVVVDDAHWLDEESQRAVLFAARRLEAEGVVLLLAVRDAPATAFLTSGLPTFRIQPLDERAGRELLERSGVDLDPHVVEAIVGTAGGNPLALIEVPGLLSAEQRAGREPHPDPLPVGEAIASAFRRRIDVLGTNAQKALLVAAADAEAETRVILLALADLGLPGDSLEEAEAARLIDVGPRIRFLHPLLRSIAYHGAAASERRAAHRALGRAQQGGSEAAHRRTWHLALAATEPDEDLAQALDAMAADARGRVGFAAAAVASERAARLTPDADIRVRRLIQAATDCQLAARLPLAESLAEEAAGLTSDSGLRAEARQLLARSEMISGQPMRAQERLVSEANLIAETHPEQAATLLAEAALACMIGGEPRTALHAGRRALELAPAGGVAQLVATFAYAEAAILCGEAAAVGQLLSETTRALVGAPPLTTFALFQSRAGLLMVVGEYGEARATAEQLVGLARSASAPGALPFPLATLAEIDFRTGQWADASARASEAAQIAEETGQPAYIAYAQVVLAKLAAARGQRVESAALLERALGVAHVLGVGAMLFYVSAARAFLELGSGRLEEAIAAGEEVARLSHERGLLEPGVLWWAPDLIEAYVRSGRNADALRVLERFEGEAESTGRVTARAAAARCRGLLASEDAFEAAFEQALRLHGEAGTPFELARTQLCLGERRRRAGRRVDAREALRAALTVFDRLEAAPWGDRARSELGASGETVRRRSEAATEDLTSHELQVARVVAQGATNREAAAQLFLSPKTIDFHLRNVYRKLGIRSRTELARELAFASAD